MNFAKQIGYEFVDRDINDNCIVRIGSKDVKYKLLNICEFNSTRKRMSCIFEQEGTKDIILMCKGADSIIYDLLNERSKKSETYIQT